MLEMATIVSLTGFSKDVRGGMPEDLLGCFLCEMRWRDASRVWRDRGEG